METVLIAVLYISLVIHIVMIGIAVWRAGSTAISLSVASGRARQVPIRF